MQVVLVDHLCVCDLALLPRCVRQDRFQIKHILEFKLQIFFYDLLDVQVVLVSLQGDLQDRWQFLESDELEGILLSKVVSLVLVLSIQPFLLDVLPHTVLDGVVAAHPQLYRVELVLARRLVLDVDTFYDILRLSFKESVEGSLNRRILHLLVELVAENTVELVHVLLLVDVLRVPPESLKELVSANER